ncbi:MAG: RNA polymerase sigma factor [Sphingobium phenoxybenzoativorans]
MESAHKSTVPCGGMTLASYIPALRAFFVRNVRDQTLADDMTQEVMLRLHVRQENKTAIENMEGYLFRIAASVMTDNARRDKVRHRSSHGELSELDHPVEELSPERVLQGREQIALVAAALEELPERTRDVFVLRRFEELSYAEIAHRLDISVSAVEKHVAKAMRHILRRTAG